MGFGLVAITVWEIFAMRNGFLYAENMKAKLLRQNTDEQKSEIVTKIEPH